jgi:hypothetical protein
MAGDKEIKKSKDHLRYVNLTAGGSTRWMKNKHPVESRGIPAA